MGENGPMFEIGEDRAVVVRVVSRSEPEPDEEVAGKIRELIRNEKAEVAILEAKTVTLINLSMGFLWEVANGMICFSRSRANRRTGNQEISGNFRCCL